MASIYDISVKTIEGDQVKMEQFKGKTLLIVNTASKCGFTPQYEGLNKLYQKFKDKNFLVLGFPCNQFGAQEPGDENEIKNFCKLNYDVSFPMFAKIDVNGKEEHPLYTHLKNEVPGILGTKAIKWNFTKFLINKEGKVVARYAPTDKPEDLEVEISKIL